MATAILTGGLVTDAVRTLGAEGDGLAAPDSSVGIYEPATNLIANPNAKTNTAGWQGVIATLARDTTDGRFANDDATTTSFKLTCTTNSDMQLLASAAASGAPLAQNAPVLYSAWVNPSVGAEGKTVRLQINETGGAQALAFYTKSAVLVAGWQRIKLLIPRLAQPDRTTLVAYVLLIGAVAGDTLNVGGIMLDRTASVVTPYAATTRTAGRIRLPMTGVSPARGWVALSVRPDWGDGVPGAPVMLWSWRDDATHRLDLRWEAGRFRMRRSSPSGTEEAAAIGVPGPGETVAVIGRWTETGVSVSKRGQPFRAEDTLYLDDDFQRADQASWGTPPVGPAWTINGAGAAGAAISGGKATAPNDTVYGYVRPMQPVSRMWARVLWPAEATSGVVALLSSRHAASNIQEMTHFIATVTNWALQVTETTPGMLIGILSAAWSSPLAMDGVTPLDFAIFYDGDVCYLELFDGTRRMVRDARIAALNQGSFISYELHRTPASGSATPQFDAVQAEIPIGSESTSGGFVPVISAANADVGSAGDGTGFLDGDVLWVMAGAGTLVDADSGVLAAFVGDPTQGTPPKTSQPRIGWDAASTPLWQYQGAVLGVVSRRLTPVRGTFTRRIAPVRATTTRRPPPVHGTALRRSIQ